MFFFGGAFSNWKSYAESLHNPESAPTLASPSDSKREAALRKLHSLERGAPKNESGSPLD